VAGRSDPKLCVALAALRDALDAAGVPWMCIGGIAVIAQGVRRTTTDIDVAVRGDTVDLDDLVRRFARWGIRPRIADAVAFARKAQVLLVEHSPTGVELDVSLAWLSFEHDALTSRVMIDFAGVAAPAARPEDLVIYKIFAARPHDMKDAETLLLLHHAEIDHARVRRVLEELGELSEDPGVPLRLEKLRIRRSRAKRRPKPTAHKPGR
jgi:hypothetical protein